MAVPLTAYTGAMSVFWNLYYPFPGAPLAPQHHARPEWQRALDCEWLGQVIAILSGLLWKCWDQRQGVPSLGSCEHRDSTGPPSYSGWAQEQWGLRKKHPMG